MGFLDVPAYSRVEVDARMPAAVVSTTAELIAALDSVTAGTIVVREGLYLLAGGLGSPRAGVRLLGQGFGTHIRLGNGVDETVLEIGNDAVIIENLRIDGNKTNQNTPRNGIKFTSPARYGKLVNCWVHDCSGYNIVAFPGTSHLVIAGNHSFGGGQEGIELQGCSSSSVVGNVVEVIGSNGIYLWNSSGDCGHNTVNGNTVRGCGGNGILVQDGAHDNAVSGNTVSDCAGHGIQVDGGGISGRPIANVVAANTCRSNGQSGISAIGMDGGSISGNSCRANVAYGIALSQGGDPEIRNRGVVVVGNACAANGLAGIFLGGGIGCGIDSNVSRDNQQSGIHVADSSDCSVVGNKVFDNSGAGVGGHDGISLAEAVRCAVTANVVYDGRGDSARQRFGIRELTASSGPNVITGNVVHGNVGGGQISVQHSETILENNLET